jgi:isopenicillin N synthase-like dioxygenase
VLIPETEVKKRVPRQSITYFVHPDDHIMVSPFNGDEADEKIKPVSAFEHAKMRLDRSYNKY